MSESKSASVVFTNGSLLAKNAQAAAGGAKSAADNAYNLAYSAQKTADGKNSIYRGSDPSTVPTANLKVGDLYFSDNAVYVWNGSSWEEAVSDTTGAEIHKKVEDAMAEKDKAIAELDANIKAKAKELDDEIKKTQGQTGFFIGAVPPSNPVKGTVWATTDQSGNMTSAKTWDGSSWVSTAFTQDLVAGNITASKIVGGTLDVNKITVANAQNIPITSTVSLGDKLSYIEQDADSLNAYVKGSKGSKTLEAILSMDPDHSSIAQVVNGQIAAAIGTYSDGSVRIDGKALYINSHAKIDDATIKSAMIDSLSADKITAGTLNADHVRVINLDANSITTGRLSGKNIELDGNTIVTGQLDLMKKDSNWVKQSSNYHNPWTWNNAHIYFNNYLQLLGENCDVTYTDNSHLNGGREFYSISTLTPGYLKFTTYQNKVSTTDKNFDGQITRTYIDSSRIETEDAWLGDLRIVGHHIRPADDKFVLVSNHAGTNFDSNGSVGFQLYGGVGLGQNTIYTASRDLYIQAGNAVQNLGQSYSTRSKTTIHCQNVISQVANKVSSRLSVKTDITPVSYDRALAAVMGTEMYDYRYTSDESGQHYVSGIIDDVNPDPQYHMDDMLINKERTARIDANLIGYHHVILQELIKKVDELEIKLKSLESKEK
ncbi:minor structural protein gp58 [Lactobacillus phage LL-H]|uniref:tail protein n=1 Tax=Lactococcus phage LL-H TaxID=12348 RepID=UPI000009BFCB|nr:tail protein [Lactobacillus phage LL-H]AAC00551.1 minor structural protein gp58 [Lactobacillus phage LL-H]